MLVVPASDLIATIGLSIAKLRFTMQAASVASPSVTSVVRVAMRRVI